MLLKKNIVTSIVVLLVTFLTGSVYAHSDGGIVIKDAWVREAPPSAKVLAAYMTIENHTDKDKVLVSVTSSAFDKIEIHKTINKDGMASMEQQKELTIASQGEVKLESGGLHLMLYNPANSLKAGDNVSFTLKFANGSTSMISATVKKATGGTEHHHHSGHDEHSMHGEPEKKSKQDDGHHHQH
jgi:copper(I)-binding protein